MNGTKLPDSVKELSKEKEITLFVDGDRGGKLIIQNVSENAEIDYVVVAPDGKEVEELTNKEALMSLRKKIPLREYLSKHSNGLGSRGSKLKKPEPKKTEKASEFSLNDADKKKLKEISDSNQGTNKAILLDDNLKQMRSVSAKTVSNALRNSRNKPSVIVMDGLVTSGVIKAAEDVGVSVIAARNFGTTDTNIELLSL
jgi:DNA primase